MSAFEKYLAQGADAVSPDRRQEVRAEIEKQRALIGAITVRTVPESAEVRVDGVLVGTTPLAQPVLVSAGMHTVDALHAGYVSRLRELTVAGMAQIEIELRLDPVVAPDTAEKAGKAPPSPPASPSRLGKEQQGEDK